MLSLNKWCQAILLLFISLHARGLQTEVKIFILGEAFSLPCDVDTRLNYLSYSWKKNDKVITLDQKISVDPRSGTLTIYSPTPEDEGTYRCFANNSYGWSVALEIELLQAFHQHFKRVGVSETFIPEVGSPYIISCQPPPSQPPSRVYWALESDRLPEEFADGNRIDTDFQGNLFFSNVELNDGMKLKYFCMSHNELLGSHYTDDGRYLSPLPKSYGSSKKPMLMWSSAINDTAIVGSKKILKCIFGGTPTPEVTWKNPTNQHAVVANGNEFIIPFVSVNDEGTYECHAHNRVGHASSAVHLRVHAIPQWGSPGKPPSLIEIDVDSNITINCDVMGLPLPAIKWFNNGKPMRLNNNSRVRIEEGSLSIYHAMLRDTATYQCLASNDYGGIIANIVVLVRESQPYFDEDPQNVKALVGYNVTFNCKVKGAPRPEVTWFKGHFRSRIANGMKYSIHPSGRLHIWDVQKEDESAYFCVATNKFQEIESSAYLTVREAPIINDEAQHIVTSSDENLYLRCGIWFDPQEATETHWLRDDSRIHVTDDALKLTGSNLHIEAVDGGDSGVYRCVMEWEGEVIARSKGIKVVVAGVPDTPYNISIEDCSDAHIVKISWTVGFNNHKDITSCHTHKMIISKDNKIDSKSISSNSLKILQTNILERKKLYLPFEVVRDIIHVQPWTAYSFRVACSNALGSSGLSDAVSCKTSATVPTRNPTNVCVKLVGTSQLVVVWEPLTEDNLNGDRFHYIVSYRPMRHNGPFNRVFVNSFNQSSVVILNQEPFTLFLISVQSANVKGHLNILPKDYVFGYSSEKIPQLTPTQFKVAWTNSSKIKFSWSSHGEQQLGAFVRGFQIKIWKKMDPSEFVLKEVKVDKKSHECGSHINSNLSQLNMGFEMHTVVDLKWYNMELLAAIRYVTSSHKGPLSSQIFVTVSDDIRSSLTLEQIGTNHVFIGWRCIPKASSGKYSHKISLSEADTTTTLQIFYTKSNDLCSHLIKVKNLYPMKKYAVNITDLELDDAAHDGSKHESIEFVTKAFYVPDEPIIENIEFVDTDKINVVLSSSFHPPSDYCIQYQNDESKEWADHDQCKSLQLKNCTHSKHDHNNNNKILNDHNNNNNKIWDDHNNNNNKILNDHNNNNNKIDHFEIHDFEDHLIRKLSLDVPIETSFVRILSFNILNNCSIAQAVSTPFKMLTGPNKESMLHGDNNSNKTIIWLIVISVLSVLFLVIFAAIFLCITSWKGQVYSVRSSERCSDKNTNSTSAQYHVQDKSMKINTGFNNHQFDSKVDAFRTTEEFWREELLKTTYKDFDDDVCRTPPIANTLV